MIVQAEQIFPIVPAQIDRDTKHFVLKECFLESIFDCHPKKDFMKIDTR